MIARYLLISVRSLDCDTAVRLMDVMIIVFIKFTCSASILDSDKGESYICIDITYQHYWVIDRSRKAFGKMLNSSLCKFLLANHSLSISIQIHTSHKLYSIRESIIVILSKLFDIHGDDLVTIADLSKRLVSLLNDPQVSVRQLAFDTLQKFAPAIGETLMVTICEFMHLKAHNLVLYMWIMIIDRRD